MKRTVQDVLRSKGHDIWSVAPDDTIYDALKLMAEKDIGSVLVMEDDKLVGILSERDYARKVILQGLSSKTAPVKAIMTANVEVVQPDESIENCMALMTEKHIRHLPVVAEGRVVGLISIGDVVKAVISDQAFMLEQLESYITGQG